MNAQSVMLLQNKREVCAWYHFYVSKFQGCCSRTQSRFILKNSCHVWQMLGIEWKKNR